MRISVQTISFKRHYKIVGHLDNEILSDIDHFDCLAPSEERPFIKAPTRQNQFHSKKAESPFSSEDAYETLFNLFWGHRGHLIILGAEHIHITKAFIHISYHGQGYGYAVDIYVDIYVFDCTGQANSTKDHTFLLFLNTAQDIFL